MVLDKLYYYRAKVISVYDGDTITVMLDMGLNQFTKIKVRLVGINTPEIRTKDLDEKKRGYQARDYLREQILDKQVIIHTTKKGKYGRWLGIVWLMEDDNDTIQKSINENLILKGHATRYA